MSRPNIYNHNDCLLPISYFQTAAANTLYARGRIPRRTRDERATASNMAKRPRHEGAGGAAEHLDGEVVTDAPQGVRGDRLETLSLAGFYKAVSGRSQLWKIARRLSEKHPAHREYELVHSPVRHANSRHIQRLCR